MPNLRDIRKRIEASIAISKITSTMEKIATARMTIVMQKMDQSKSYSASLLSMAEDLFLSAMQEDQQQEFCILAKRKQILNAGVVFITSNQGMCAGFNVGLNQELIKLEESLRPKGVNLHYYVVGKKGVAHLKHRHLSPEYSLVNLKDRFAYHEIQEMRNRLVEDIQKAIIDEIYIIYTHYTASAGYQVVCEPLSPCKVFNQRLQDGKIGKVKPMICHPNIPELIEAFLPEVILNRLYTALLESMVCEQIVRRMAMKQATEAADDMIEELRSLYHTVRQAKITKEVNELMGTVLALQKD